MQEPNKMNQSDYILRNCNTFVLLKLFDFFKFKFIDHNAVVPLLLRNGAGPLANPIVVPWVNINRKYSHRINLFTLFLFQLSIVRNKIMHRTNAHLLFF